ncbi:hypothetical protein PoB_006985800 [Plakobranchus ocellatus]|uniref:Prokineticin domain-containing protein n=1 Tax=Plakobranchus ocellatus TaxID=259542 RepID=A0AAV4DGC0_9GAST|nr:hypothetical protein PoB_006985800 [Plakobranchus ocellatus]
MVIARLRQSDFRLSVFRPARALEAGWNSNLDSTVKLTLKTMMLKPILCLAVVAVLAHQTNGRIVACKQLNQECTPLTNSCCSGLKCEQGGHGMASGFRCKESSPIGRCLNKGQPCTPGVNDNCCSGLYCKARVLNPNVHECEESLHVALITGSNALLCFDLDSYTSATSS